MWLGKDGYNEIDSVFEDGPGLDVALEELAENLKKSKIKNQSVPFGGFFKLLIFHVTCSETWEKSLH